MPRGILKRQQNGSNPSSKTPISRSKSISKIQRTTFYRKKLHQLNKAAPEVVPIHSRWANVTTNMVDVLGGIFRTEVDEMLTPSRMRQPRSEISSVADQEASTGLNESVVDSNKSIEKTDRSTPTKPSHLENLSARISAPPLVSPVSPCTPLTPGRPSSANTSNGKGKETSTNAELEVSPMGDPGMTFEDLNFPSPPPPPLPRKSSLRPKPPRALTLPTISESSALIFDHSQPGDAKERRPLLARAPSALYATIRSTPYTLTSPLFRHGNIRIERPRLRRKEARANNALDWTAFQIAISGTMNDEDGKTDNVERNFDEQELDELMEWWDSFHLPMGEIVREIPKVKRMVVYIKDKNNQETRWKAGSGVEKRLSTEGTTWGVKMEEEHVDSLPTSPMQDLVPPNSSDSIIPMGYNLGHDLGDFLSWEVQHVQNL